MRRLALVAIMLMGCAGDDDPIPDGGVYGTDGGAAKLVQCETDFKLWTWNGCRIGCWKCRICAEGTYGGNGEHDVCPAPANGETTFCGMPPANACDGAFE